MRTQPLEPRRVRHPRGAYGWVDLKVVTSGLLQRIGSDAAFTYLFLCAVGNMQGVSFWSRWRMAQTLGLSLDAIEAAVHKLQDVDLIASNGKVFQVLSLAAATQDEGQSSPSALVAAATLSGGPRSAVTTTGGSSVAPELDDGEIRLHEPEARRRLAKLAPRTCSEAVRRVARAMALEARRARCG